MGSRLGWTPSTSQGHGLTWFCCWQSPAGLACLFPASFIPFFFTSLGCSELFVPWCGYTWSARIHSPIPKDFHLPSSHRLYDPPPPAAASSSSLPIFSQLLILPKELSEVEGGFNLLENSDFAASCVSSNDRVGSGFRTWPLFYFAASKSHPLILNHFTDSLEQIDAAFQEKPNHSQITWHEVLQISGGVDHL